jgi:hypothetical protein
VPKKAARRKSTVKRKARAARPRPAAGKQNAGLQSRVTCIECGRELWVSNWGASERSIYCCGRVMEKKA